MEKCIGPAQNSYSATAPFESILAEGDPWRKAIASDRWIKPVRLIIVAFVILLILSIAVGWFLPR